MEIPIVMIQEISVFILVSEIRPLFLWRNPSPIPSRMAYHCNDCAVHRMANKAIPAYSSCRQVDPAAPRD